MTLEKVRHTMWQIHTGTIQGTGGLFGQLTEFNYKGFTVYVRESDLRVNANSFTTSSNERWGMKHGKSSKKNQVLELCAPPELWQEIAMIIPELDPLKRPVMFHCKFTADWAIKQFVANITERA